MPASYTIDTSQHIVRITMSGNIVVTEIMELLKDVTVHESYKNNYSFIFDVRSIAQYLSYQETVTLFEFYKSSLNNTIRGKIAVIISKSVQYGVTRIASTIFGTLGIDVDGFYTEEEALEWIQSATS